MNKGALALLVHGGTENWSPVRWKTRFDDVCGDRQVVLMPDAQVDPADVIVERVAARQVLDHVHRPTIR